jgi:hypothetical protein
MAALRKSVVFFEKKRWFDRTSEVVALSFILYGAYPNPFNHFRLKGLIFFAVLESSCVLEKRFVKAVPRCFAADPSARRAALPNRHSLFKETTKNR